MELDPPPWLNRMREMGYPPGYLDVGAEDQPSGITIFDCHDPILSGNRWSCNQCKRFHLCSRCAELERESSEQITHTSIRGEKHELYQIRVNDVSSDTEDGDFVLENDIFNDRQSFLKFYQGNHYQFDSLGLAKHSSMMILHQLKNCLQHFPSGMMM
ncbi:hypothetical protein CASFOL_011282 [Castilleja foliolosa]|uniref:histone acetyltransferase n=1 Tax=Castilleja foliolosa TaxID=1961234 RepID=A0ABD3DWV6_9LAMI